MGACLSCLDFNRHPPSSYPDEDARLLPADQYLSDYGAALRGSLGSQSPRADPENSRREREVLDRICTRTSDQFFEVPYQAVTDDRSKVTSDLSRVFKDAFPVSTADPARYLATEEHLERNARKILLPYGPPVAGHVETLLKIEGLEDRSKLLSFELDDDVVATT